MPHKQFPLQGFSPRGKTCDPEHSKKTKKKENTGTVTTPALDYVPTFLFGTHFFKSVHTSPSSCFWATVRVICSLQRRVKKHWRTVRRDATKKQTRVLASDERKPWIKHLITLQWLLETAATLKRAAVWRTYSSAQTCYNTASQESNLIYSTCS